MSNTTRIVEQRTAATRRIGVGDAPLPTAGAQVFHAVVAAVDEGTDPPTHVVHRVAGAARLTSTVVTGGVSTTGSALAVGTPVLVLLHGGVPQLFVGGGAGTSALVPLHGHTSDSDGGFVAASVTS